MRKIIDDGPIDFGTDCYQAVKQWIAKILKNIRYKGHFHDDEDLMKEYVYANEVPGIFHEDLSKKIMCVESKLDKVSYAMYCWR